MQTDEKYGMIKFFIAVRYSDRVQMWPISSPVSIFSFTVFERVPG